MTTIKTKNNFSSFKGDFLKDTGKKADDNIELYTQYVTARFADYNYQMQFHILNKLANLPQEIDFHTRQK